MSDRTETDVAEDDDATEGTTFQVSDVPSWIFLQDGDAKIQAQRVWALDYVWPDQGIPKPTNWRREAEDVVQFLNNGKFPIS